MEEEEEPPPPLPPPRQRQPPAGRRNQRQQREEVYEDPPEEEQGQKQKQAEEEEVSRRHEVRAVTGELVQHTATFCCLSCFQAAFEHDPDARPAAHGFLHSGCTCAPHALRLARIPVTPHPRFPCKQVRDLLGALQSTLDRQGASLSDMWVRCTTACLHSAGPCLPLMPASPERHAGVWRWALGLHGAGS